MKDGWKRSSEVHLLPRLAGLDENIVQYIFRTKLVLYYYKAKAFLLSLVCLVFLSLSAKIFFFSCHYNFPRHCSRSCTQPSRLFCRALVGGGILADVPSFVGLLHSHIQCWHTGYSPTSAAPDTSPGVVETLPG